MIFAHYRCAPCTERSGFLLDGLSMHGVNSFGTLWTGPVIGITRWNKRLYLGNEFDARNLEQLKQLGITAVANLTPNPVDYPPGSGIIELVLGQHDGEEAPDENIEGFFTWMDHRLAQGNSILVRCHAGISRTPAFFIGWLLHCSGASCDTDLRGEWSRWEDAVGLRRPVIMPHSAIKRSILRYFASKSPIDRQLDADHRPDKGVFVQPG